MRPRPPPEIPKYYKRDRRCFIFSSRKFRLSSYVKSLFSTGESSGRIYVITYLKCTRTSIRATLGTGTPSGSFAGGHTPHLDKMSSLPFYSAWSTRRRREQPKVVKQRKPRSHMRPYVGIIPPKRLEQERAKIEKSLAHFFTPNTEHLRYRGIVQWITP